MHRHRHLAVVATALTLLFLPAHPASAQVDDVEMAGTLTGTIEPTTAGGIPPFRVTGSGQIRGVSIEFFVERAPTIRAQGRVDIPLGHELEFEFDQDISDGRAEFSPTDSTRGLRGEVLVFQEDVVPSLGCVEVRLDGARLERVGLVITASLTIDVKIEVPCSSGTDVLAEIVDVEAALVVVPDESVDATGASHVVGALHSIASI